VSIAGEKLAIYGGSITAAVAAAGLAAWLGSTPVQVPQKAEVSPPQVTPAFRGGLGVGIGHIR
jgi:hypothetical protein